MGIYTAMVSWLQQHMLTCPSKKLLYIDCPGCGLQRSFIALLKGDIVQSWHIYPPTTFILTTLLFLVIHLALDLKHGAFILKCFYIVSISVILVNYVFKLTTHQLA